jgi:hypothetical protein
MKRIVVVLGVAAVMAAMVTLTVGTALAQTSANEVLDANTLGLDQSVNAYGSFHIGQKSVQTFTAEHDGQLTTVEVKIHVDSAWAPIEGLRMDITTVDPATGLPTSNVLASTTIPSSAIPSLPVNTNPSLIPLTTLTFENPPTVEAGQRYAIVLDTIAPDEPLHFLRWTTTVQEYDGGQGMWIRDNGTFISFLPQNVNASDQVFAVYVTTPDTTPPEVSGTEPSNFATGVPATADISATFLEEGSGIDTATLTTGFKVEQVKPTGNAQVDGNVAYDEGSQTATFDPLSSLANGLYLVTLTGVEDNAGNVMPDYTWIFSTVGARAKPTRYVVDEYIPSEGSSAYTYLECGDYSGRYDLSYHIKGISVTVTHTNGEVMWLSHVLTLDGQAVNTETGTTFDLHSVSNESHPDGDEYAGQYVGSQVLVSHDQKLRITTSYTVRLDENGEPVFENIQTRSSCPV